jgi:Zn-dependent M28 family amino/carboxypeptidase
MTHRKTSMFLLMTGLALIAGTDSRAADTTGIGGEGAFTHLQALQAVAAASGGNRAAGTPGFDRSVGYVAGRLKAAGYDVRLEEFEFPYFEERSPPILKPLPDGASLVVPSEALQTLANSGAGTLAAKLQPVDFAVPADSAPSTSGCETSDFQGFGPGAIALVRRGTCPFQTKVDNAEAAGAAGVIIANSAAEAGAFAGRLTRPARLPVVGVSPGVGHSLDEAVRANPDFAVQLAVDALAGTRSTRNLFADASAGPATQTVVVGAHLDSVPEGPGINDNGSGSAAVLEAALRLGAAPLQPGKRVRFAFWGAEERGLLGSRHHVEALPEDERRRIALYINLDMVGSPNFGRFVQGSAASPDGLAALARQALLGYFQAKGLAVDERLGRDRPRSFGSDDASFARVGIPTLGLYTGAGEAKAEAQAERFGGQANTPYDPCYHRACDSLENIDRGVLDAMTEALETTLRVLAYAGGQPEPGEPGAR